jgi:hypothetical protein
MTSGERPSRIMTSGERPSRIMTSGERRLSRSIRRILTHMSGIAINNYYKSNLLPLYTRPIDPARKENPFGFKERQDQENRRPGEKPASPGKTTGTE